MLIPIVGSGQYDAAFVPDDLLWIEKSDSFEAVQHFTGKYGRMPDIRNLQRRDEFEGIRPVGTSVSGDGGLGMTCGSALHVTRLCRAVAVQAGAVAPFGIERNSVRRISHHESRLLPVEKPRHIGLAGSVAAQYAVRPAQPQITRARDRNFGNRWHVVFGCVRRGA